MSLKNYQRKRKFNKTPEPKGREKKGRGALKFVVHMHRATRMHYDLRLEIDGVFKSWAVPKGPSLNPLDQRLAVFVEDHPLDYGKFEGVIPKGNYGAGAVLLWDTGTYVERSSTDRQQSEKAMAKGLEKGHITFVLNGKKLKGEFALVRIKKGDQKNWLLLKKRDDQAAYFDILQENTSVKTGRTLEEVSKELKKKVKWKPKIKTKKKKKSTLTPMPRKTKAMIPSKSLGIFESKKWVYSPVRGGVRCIAEMDSSGVKLYSRQLLPLNKKYPKVVDGLKSVEEPLVLDGEIVKIRQSFTFLVWDVIFGKGKSLKEEPLKKRLKVLESLKKTKAFQVVDFQNGGGVEFLKKHRRKKASGVLMRHQDSSYGSGVSNQWLEYKVSNEIHQVDPPDIKVKKRNKAPKVSTGLSTLHLTHLDKIYWPQEKITKGDLINYYRDVSSTILPYLKNRPHSLHRHPGGINGQSFFQKDLTGYVPRFFKTQRVESRGQGKTINFALCQDQNSLLYLANLGCIELNPWFSSIDNIDCPDFLVIDLDPDGNDFKEVVKVAKVTHQVLESIGAKSFCKTSGADGLHICIPTQGRYDFDECRDFAYQVVLTVQQKLPKLTSVLRSPSQRRGKIYLDFMQNRRGQTLAAPYCVRPRPGATVSTPLKWSEVNGRLDPRKFTIFNTSKRLKKVGDLWKPMLKVQVDLKKCLKKLKK